jgi:hypothetical protein
MHQFEDSKPPVLAIDESKFYQEPFQEMLFAMAVDAAIIGKQYYQVRFFPRSSI